MGRTIARHMGLNEKIAFVERAVDLEFVRGLPPVDTILCLNFLHHAGSSFDVEKVKRDGWEQYAEDWLSAMRATCRLAIVAMGFKHTKPRYWNTPHPHRPARFAQLAERAGWSILYDANVHEIHVMGVEHANGRYTKRGHVFQPEHRKSSLGALIKRVRGLLGFKQLPRDKMAASKRRKYHLYILEGVPRDNAG
jgi:hypothetical protein